MDEENPGIDDEDTAFDRFVDKHFIPIVIAISLVLGGSFVSFVYLMMTKTT